MTVTSRAVLHVHPGRRDEFLAVAGALAAAAAEEDRTLRYDWYASVDDGDVFVAIEEYVDGAAALAHNEHCQALLDRIPQVADMTAVDLYGDLGPQLEQWVAEHPFAHEHQPLRW